MTEFLYLAAIVLLIGLGLGLVRVFRDLEINDFPL